MALQSIRSEVDRALKVGVSENYWADTPVILSLAKELLEMIVLTTSSVGKLHKSLLVFWLEQFEQ